MAFGAPSHPNSLGACPDDPLDAGPEWTPFDFTLSRFLHATGARGGVGAAGRARRGGECSARRGRCCWREAAAAAPPSRGRRSCSASAPRPSSPPHPSTPHPHPSTRLRAQRHLQAHPPLRQGLLDPVPDGAGRAAAARARASRSGLRDQRGQAARARGRARRRGAGGRRPRPGRGVRSGAQRSAVKTPSRPHHRRCLTSAPASPPFVRPTHKVGTTPVILGRKLPTTSYVLTDRWGRPRRAGGGAGKRPRRRARGGASEAGPHL
jgi:hypothetical protein